MLYVVTFTSNMLTVKNDETTQVERATKILWQGSSYDRAVREANIGHTCALSIGRHSENLTIEGDQTWTGQCHPDADHVFQWEIEIDHY